MILFLYSGFFSIWLLSFNHIVFAIVFFPTFFCYVLFVCGLFDVVFFQSQNTTTNTPILVCLYKTSWVNPLCLFTFDFFLWFAVFFPQKNSIRILNVVWLVVLCALPVIEYLHMVCVNLLFFFRFLCNVCVFPNFFSLVNKSLIFEFLKFSLSKTKTKNQTFRMYWKCFGLIAV